MTHDGSAATMTTAAGTAAMPLGHANRRPPGWLSFLKRLVTTKPLGAFGLFVVIAMIVSAALAPVIAPYPPADPIGTRLETPSSTHSMGTDNSGRDILSRVVYGARVAAIVGFGAVAISTLGALLVGVITGYFGGVADALIQRVVDAIMAIPALVLVMAIVTVTGAGLWQLTVILGLYGIAGSSRIVRSAVLGIRQVAYLEAARALGAGHLRVMLRHVLPNIFAPVMVSATVGLGGVILVEAASSFLGLGISDPNQPTWGQMLSQARRFIDTDFNYVLWPCLAITFVVFAFNMLGDALRDLLDPRLRGDR